MNVTHAMSVMSKRAWPGHRHHEGSPTTKAVKLMNDSKSGLTAALWTSDVKCRQKIGEQIDTGTVYMNRCDYLDPALAWVGSGIPAAAPRLSPSATEMPDPAEVVPSADHIVG